MAPIETPKEVADAGLVDWFQGLKDPDKVKVRRYVQGIDTTSPEAFLKQLMERSSEDHNYGLSAVAGAYANTLDLDDYTRFLVNEAYIEGLFGGERYEEAKEVCAKNLDMFPLIKDRFLADNGGILPKHIACRNRLIDIVIGVESGYDLADEILSQYVAMGLLDEEEKAYRLQSIKIHRMQKTFDNLFIYRPKE
mgnify:CR=1 FL=1